MDSQVCSFCVMTSEAPGVVIDEDGQCNCCKDALARRPFEWWPNEEGQRRINALVAQLQKQGKGKSYDALIGLSGGVDSAYLAHYMSTRYGLRMLAVHVDAGWNSGAAVHNIENLVRKLNLDLITYVVEWNEMRDLQRSFLHAGVLNQDFPQDHAFFATLLRTAEEHKIVTFLSGVNFSSENIHMAHDGPTSIDGRHVRAIHDEFGKVPLTSYPLMTLTEYLWVTQIRGKPKRIRPLDFINYNKEEARKELERIYGWKDYGPKHSESRFTKFYQEIYLPRKLQFDKRRLHLSSLIVSGQITRDMALQELAKPLISEQQLASDIRFVAKKLEMTTSELISLIEAPLRSHDNYANDKEIISVLQNARSLIRKIKNCKFLT